MDLLHIAILGAWFLWHFLYWWLVWASRSEVGVSYFKLLMPLVILFRSAWPEDFLRQRNALVVILIIILAAAFIQSSLNGIKIK